MFRATKRSDTDITTILRNNAIETRPWNKIHDLREKCSTCVHRAPDWKTRSGKMLPRESQIEFKVPPKITPQKPLYCRPNLLNDPQRTGQRWYFFGTPRTWRASCTNTKCITTRIEFIVRSAARHPRYAPAYPQLLQPRLTVTRGSHTAAVCFRLRSPPDLYFATHRRLAMLYSNPSIDTLAVVISVGHRISVRPFATAIFCVPLTE